MAKRRADLPPSDDSEEGRAPDDDRVRFPFGETASGEEDLFGSGSGDGDLLDDSDLDGISSGSGDALDDEPLGSSAEGLLPRKGGGHHEGGRPARRRGTFETSDSQSQGSKSKLPSMPPDADPSDDASLDSLEHYRSGEEDLVDLADSRELPEGMITDLGRVSDLGPISPSGPLVIVDDDEGVSTRYQASIVDDSARLAGSASVRAKPPRKGQKSWREEAVDDDVDVPTLSGRRGRGEAAPPPPAGGRGPVLVLSALLVAALAALGGLELKRRNDLAELAARLGQEHSKAQDALRQEGAKQVAAAKEADKQDAQREVDAARQAGRAEAEQARAEAAEQARAARAAGEAAARQAAAGERERAVREAVDKERERAEQEQRAAVNAELARLRGERESEVAARLKGAVDEERRRGEAAREEALRSAEDRHRAELERLRKELSEELAKGGASREDDEELARALERDRKEALDDAGGGKAAGAGGKVGGSVDDWEKEFFSDSSDSSGGEGGSGEGGKGEDLFADSGSGGGGADEDDDRHPVDKVWDWLKGNIHGTVGYKNLSHFSTGPRHDARKTRHELRIALDYRGWLWQNESGSTGLRVVTELDVKADDDSYATGLPRGIDDDDLRRPILTTKEFYAGLTVEKVELKVGYQIFGWGTGDLYNPTDNLNPIDFSDPFDSRRIPVFAATVTIDLDWISLELASIPTFTRSRLPLKNRRFDALASSPLPVLNPTDPEVSLQNVQWGARAVAHLGGVDVSLSCFTGFNDLPSPRLALIQAPQLALVVDPVYERIHVLGVDFATTLGVLGLEGGRLAEVLKGIQLHGEAAHFFNEGSRASDYLQFALGLNYQFVDVILEHDITLVLEFGSDIETKAAEDTLQNANRLDRVFKTALLARLVYAVSDDLSFELNGGVIFDGPENGIVHPAAKWNVTNNLQLELAGDVFFGPDGTFFGQFRKEGRVIMEARWKF
ncbi:MAG: hypothetical protein AB7N76_15845 [Planctomycetota bacterium]